MKRFIILYDCPIKKCDKIWLYENLKRYGDVKIVNTGINMTYFRLSRILPKLKLGKMMVKILIYIQTFKALLFSNKKDIIITWSHSQGIIFNKICKKLKTNRVIISFNWIYLPKTRGKDIENCLNNKNFIPIINNVNLEKGFKKLFNLKNWNGFYLPDVFDTKDEWLKPKFNKKDEKYVFSGGVNNRDWNILMQVAKETPDIKYIIVTGKNDINNKYIADNVKYFEELQTDEYYNLMKGSFLTVCPLKNNTVSGLINIIKSIQYGIPCVSTNIDVTAIYYPETIKKELQFKRNSKEELKKCILKCFSYTEKEYINRTLELQKYLKENFNPEKNVKDLIEELKKRKIFL